MLRCIFTLENPRYDSPRALQEVLKKDPKAIETLPWQCQSTEQNNASLVNQRPVDGEESMDT